MKLIGLMPVKNEDWILGLSARVALTWCDELEILLHCCTDRSEEIVGEIMREYPLRVTYTIEDDPRWDEMAHRQYLLQSARRSGNTTHIALIDADEILTGNLTPAQVRFWIETMEPGMMLQLPLYNMRGGMYRCHANGLWGNRFASVVFKDEPKLHWKGDRFHHREPMGRKYWNAFTPLAHGEGGIMHLWGASEARLLAKHALFKVTERLRWPQKDVREIDRYYSMCVNGQTENEAAGWMFATVPASWWAPYTHWLKYLDVTGFSNPGCGIMTNAEPWQAAEVRRLIAEHGRDTFAGLDLFGVGQ